MSVTAFRVTKQVAHRNIGLLYYDVITKFSNRYVYDEDRESSRNKMTCLEIEPTDSACPGSSFP